MKEILDIHAEKMMVIAQEVDLSRPEVYANWLAQTYYYVSHSIRLLALSIAHMKDEDRSFQQRFIQHISEENNHELMAKHDLKRMGYSLEDFPELPETRMFYETQYFKIRNQDPLALMGYILALEYLAADIGPKILKLTENHQGKGFLKVHAEEDIEHVDHAFQIINELSKERREIVSANMIQSLKNYSLILENLEPCHIKTVAA